MMKYVINAAAAALSVLDLVYSKIFDPYNDAAIENNVFLFIYQD